MEIPKSPPIDIPKRNNLPLLREQTEDVKKLDTDFITDKKKFKKDARSEIKQREEVGIGSMYSEMQSKVVPKIDDTFVGKKIDVLFLFEILDGGENETGLRWCQGEVTKVISKSDKPKVEVLWDAIPELNHEQHTSIQVLPKGKWNKQIEGAWRMNVDIIDEYSDYESDQ